jgi:hypothetical protein
MPDRPAWKPDDLHVMWAKFRALFEGVGITDDLAEIDALVADAEMMLGAHDTWRYRFEKALARVTAATATVAPERARAAMPAVHELCVFIDRQEEARVASSLKRVSSPRGVGYLQFLLAAQMKVRDGSLAAMAPFVPATVLGTTDLDHQDAAGAAEPERRMRALASATKSTMESYYRPILKGVWTLSALMVGANAASPPSELGPLFRDLGKFWPRLSAPWPTDFIDEDAKFVRNAAAHQSVRFDPATDELVLANHEVEQRLKEPELRRRLGEMFERAETMRCAFLFATGQLERET